MTGLESTAHQGLKKTKGRRKPATMQAGRVTGLELSLVTFPLLNPASSLQANPRKCLELIMFGGKKNSIDK